MSFHISGSLVNRDAVDHVDVTLLSVFSESGPAVKTSSGRIVVGGFVCRPFCVRCAGAKESLPGCWELRGGQCLFIGYPEKTSTLCILVQHPHDVLDLLFLFRIEGSTEWIDACSLIGRNYGTKAEFQRLGLC
jgi:hypothetical protein